MPAEKSKRKFFELRNGLKAVDFRNKDYFDRIDDHEKSLYSPYMLMRYVSSVSSKDPFYIEHYVEKCTYCDKTFAKERTLQVHLCEPKRRHLQRDEKWVVNAFMVFQRFYQIHQHNSKPRTYDDFVDSAYYNAFVKFGRYIMYITSSEAFRLITCLCRTQPRRRRLSRIDVDHSDELDFVDGDSCVIISKGGEIRKIIVPKMDTAMRNSGGYRALLDVIDLLQPGSKEEFIKYNEKDKGSVH